MKKITLCNFLSVILVTVLFAGSMTACGTSDVSEEVAVDSATEEVDEKDTEAAAEETSEDSTEESAEEANEASTAAATEDASEDVATDDSANTYELAENAIFEQMSWMENCVFSYYPSELYDPIVSMMPVFFYYVDTPVTDQDEAYAKLVDNGMIELAEEEHAAIMLINPTNGESYGEKDYEQWLTLCKVLTKSRDLEFEYSVPYDRMDLKKLFAIGEGQGADFISCYLNTDIASTVTAGTLLVGADSKADATTYAVPGVLVGCSEDVIEQYKGINETDAEDTLNGDAVYYNSTYVMDSGYTPKRVICIEDDSEIITKDIIDTAWNDLLKLLWTQNLEYSYFTEGVECAVVSDRPNYDELNLTFNEIKGEQAKEESNGTQERWYEWVPNEVYDTMESGSEELYPLIVVMHGNGDHEIYEAESNGWVWLADNENVIVVAPKEIWESGRPPESAENRYGKENVEFIKDTICSKYPVDPSRIYIAGFSIGGFTTADTAAADPSFFAAAAPMAYPGDGYMQIFPYDEYGIDPESCDLPVMHMAGRNDGGNTMENPTDPEASRVMALQLFFNQILTFNDMTDQLLDLCDFEYDWYPGENDIVVNEQTGETTGTGYDFWDGTAASYITQNLDFETYPFYGFDVSAIPNSSQDTFTTPEGVEVERNIIRNDDNVPLLEFLVMGDMQHQHYSRYAQIIWDDWFSHYTRDPETGELSYTE